MDRTDPPTASAARSPRFEVVDAEMAALLRRKSPQERLEIADGLWRHARELLDAHFGAEHPEWDAAERQREVARRMADGSW